MKCSVPFDFLLPFDFLVPFDFLGTGILTRFRPY